MKLDSTLDELDRLEAQRKLRSIPAALLDGAWVLEAQQEAVVDALLITAAAGDERAYAHARHTGEWAARIAAELPFAPRPAFARRCGVLAELDPAVLECIPEVREVSAAVRAFQRLRMSKSVEPDVQAAALIVAVADQYDGMIFAGPETKRCSPKDALRMMLRTADAAAIEIVQALRRAICRTAPCASDGMTA